MNLLKELFGKLIFDNIRFPLWNNDKKSVIYLNKLQKKSIKEFLGKIERHEYKFKDNLCICGNKDKIKDLIKKIINKK